MKELSGERIGELLDELEEAIAYAENVDIDALLDEQSALEELLTLRQQRQPRDEIVRRIKDTADSWLLSSATEARELNPAEKRFIEDVQKIVNGYILLNQLKEDVRVIVNEEYLIRLRQQNSELIEDTKRLAKDLRGCGCDHCLSSDGFDNINRTLDKHQALINKQRIK